MSNSDCVSYGSYREMSTKMFAAAKQTAMQAIDLSKKGSVDDAILDVVRELNSCCQYFTTSSCSGRTIIVADSADRVIKKKGCDWLYVTHERADRSSVVDVLSADPLPSTASLKFEQMIMHVQCLNIESARQLLQVAVACGYRNSGMSIGKSGKIVVAVRSTGGMEVPLIAEHKLLVSEQYLEFLVDLANEKMKSNLSQIERFVRGVKDTEFTATRKMTKKEPKKRFDSNIGIKAEHAGDSADSAELLSEEIFPELFGT